MAVIEKRMVVYGGQEGYVPAYADDKAPNGDWALDPLGNQIMFENGKNVLAVNYEALGPGDNARLYYSFRDDKPSYARVWLIGDDGHGMNTQPFWVECSHLAPAAVNVDPEPEPEPDEQVELDLGAGWTEIEIAYIAGRVFIREK